MSHLRSTAVRPLRRTLAVQDGVSLMEAMVALFILAGGLLFAFNMDKIRFFSFERTRLLRQAVALIENQVEGIRVGIRATGSLPAVNTSDTTQANGITLVSSFAAATKTTPALTFAKVRQLDLVASWVADGKPDTLRVRTYVSEDY